MLIIVVTMTDIVMESVAAFDDEEPTLVGDGPRKKREKRDATGEAMQIFIRIRTHTPGAAETSWADT